MSDDSEDGPHSFDVVVVGGGPPGENVADYAHRGGLSAVIVESELVGGECSYWACMPSKALLRPVELLTLAKAMPGLKVQDTLDVAEVLDRRDEFTSHHDDASQVKWAEGAGLSVIRGHGRLAGVKTVEVLDTDGAVQRTLTANHAVVLATGTAAAVPPIPGLRDTNPWTSRDVTNLKEIPDRIVVIGGGVVGCEATTWLNGLGAKVTLLVREDRLLIRNEPFAGALLADTMRESGVDVHLSANLTEVRRGDTTSTETGRVRGAAVTVVVDGEEIEADEVLIAAGRTPRVDDLGLDVVGLKPGYLSTDDTLLVDGVDGEWLYAVGDLNGRALLTHMGKYQARVAGDVIAARAAGRSIDDRRYQATSDHGQVPQVTFTEPQVASVGLSEAEARDAGPNVRAVEFDLAAVAGTSLLRDDYKGRAKLVVDTDTQTLLGATFVGSEVGEIVHAATVAVVGKVPLDVLWHAVPSYPTASEVWLRLLETWRFE